MSSGRLCSRKAPAGDTSRDPLAETHNTGDVVGLGLAVDPIDSDRYPTCIYTIFKADGDLKISHTYLFVRFSPTAQNMWENMFGVVFERQIPEA